MKEISYFGSSEVPVFEYRKEEIGNNSPVYLKIPKVRSRIIYIKMRL
jgi:hypothetical protein